MAYPTAAEVRQSLPGENPSVSEATIEGFIKDWKAQVADAAGVASAPADDEYAEAIVRRGVHGEALKQLFLNDMHEETPAADETIKRAEKMLTHYDSRRSGEKEPGRVRSDLVSNVTRRPLWSESERGADRYPGDRW